jgi:hypothetical protein
MSTDGLISNISILVATDATILFPLHCVRTVSTTTQCFDVLTSLKRVQTFLLQSLHIPGLRDCAMAALLGVCHSSGALEFELDLVSVLLDLEDAAAANSRANGSTTTAGTTAGALSAAVADSSNAATAAELFAANALLQFSESGCSYGDNSALSGDTAAGDSAAAAAAAAATDAVTDSDSSPPAAATATVPLLQGAAAAGLYAFVREVAAETVRRRRSMHIAVDSSESSAAATAGAVTDASFDAAKSSAYVQLSEGGLVAASSDSGNRSVIAIMLVAAEILYF